MSRKRVVTWWRLRQDRIKISAAGGEISRRLMKLVRPDCSMAWWLRGPRRTIIVWDLARSMGHQRSGFRPVRRISLKAISRETDTFRSVFTLAPRFGKLIWGDLEYRASRKRVHCPHLKHEHVIHFSRIISSEGHTIIRVRWSNTEMNELAGCLYNVTIRTSIIGRRFLQ